MKTHKKHYLVVGAGFSGASVARELADHECKVTLIDKREHIGGNAYDSYDGNGVLVHNYGPHIFHTNSQRIFEYLSRFTEWRKYEHRVLSNVGGVLYPIPVNRTTINSLYNTNLDEEGIKRHIESVRIDIDQVRTSRDLVLSTLGTDIYERFFEGYTRKQWGVDASELKSSVTARIPYRTNDDDRYFNDVYQYMPANGYTELFKKLLDHPNIDILLGLDYEDVRTKYENVTTVYTGPIDEYFNYRFGRLPYRSLRFEHEHLTDLDQYQKVATVNYPNAEEFTRITEFKHITGQQVKGTSIVREYPRSEGDPYYPIPSEKNEMLYKKYQGLGIKQKHVYFVGRLGQYKYYNMDQAVAAALKISERIIDNYIDEK